MRLRAWCCVAWLCAGAATAGEPMPATLRAVGDNWCPYNCATDSQLPGYLVELMRRVLGPRYRLDYRVEPWTRAVELVTSSDADLLLATTPQTTPDLRLSVPLGVDRSCLFVRADNPWRYHRVADLEQIRLGVIQDYKYDADGPIDAMVARAIAAKSRRIEVATGEDALRQNFRKLAAGRMDAVIENENVGAWTIAQLGQRQTLVNAGCVEGYLGTVHVALAPARGDGKALLGAFDKGVAALRANGELAKILGRYGIADWQALLRKPKKKS